MARRRISKLLGESIKNIFWMRKKLRWPVAPSKMQIKLKLEGKLSIKLRDD